MVFGRERSRRAAQLLFTLIKVIVQVINHPPIPIPFLWHRTRGEASGVGILEGIALNLHIGISSHMVILHWTGTAVESGSHLSD